ncbi:hypothetical protein [Planctomyces sp. SH-PL14]|uniref:hypothetical protein n=1 Tax=Planctomyces sp. SH-PL14 TaxID=1632864 RepID=UPI00078B8BF1|nr:hypothetical protein [Planctomyces sp. SH-PL14]AMV18457.1 hypothetical protein VT03_11235 [Planctomyces sp. SH-PL14]
MSPSTIPATPASDGFEKAVEALARQDVDAMVTYLHRVLPPGTVTKTFSIPAEIYLRLAVMLRFRLWEERGIPCHIDAGLPSSSEVMHELARELKTFELKNTAYELGAHMLCVLRNDILWNTEDDSLRFKTAINVDLTDDLIDAIAGFLLQQTREI